MTWQRTQRRAPALYHARSSSRGVLELTCIAPLPRRLAFRIVGSAVAHAPPHRMVEPSGRPRIDCTRYFDVLYFCYSPVYQLNQLYRSGELDSCHGAFRDWLDCLTNKAKPDAAIQVRLDAAGRHQRGRGASRPRGRARRAHQGALLTALRAPFAGAPQRRRSQALHLAPAHAGGGGGLLARG